MTDLGGTWNPMSQSYDRPSRLVTCARCGAEVVSQTREPGQRDVVGGYEVIVSLEVTNLPCGCMKFAAVDEPDGATVVADR